MEVRVSTLMCKYSLVQKYGELEESQLDRMQRRSAKACRGHAYHVVSGRIPLEVLADLLSGICLDSFSGVRQNAES